MVIRFRDPSACNLMYHVLAHMKVKNASDLYSEDYVRIVSEAKGEATSSLTESVSRLSQYYNEQFDRLAAVNFIPIFCTGADDLIDALTGFDGFTEEDKRTFIKPLCALLSQETTFCEGRRLDQTAAERRLKERLSAYEALLSRTANRVEIVLSGTLTRNGRAFMQDDTFYVAVPLETEEKSCSRMFFQMLHEFTHQITDPIVAAPVRMDDGTHEQSENAALLFDYYLLKEHFPDDLAHYCEWINALTGGVCADEKDLLRQFKVTDKLNQHLLKLQSEII